MVPVGVPDPGSSGVTAEVKLTPDSCPYVTGDDAMDRDVFVPCWSTARLIGDDVDAL